MYVFGNTDICLLQILETIKGKKYMGCCDSQWAGKTQVAFINSADAVTPWDAVTPSMNEIWAGNPRSHPGVGTKTLLMKLL